MQTFSRFFFTILLFSGLISGLPTINNLESRTGAISQVNQEQHSKRSISTSSPHQSKRALFSNKKAAVTGQPGLTCDGTFYRQEKINAVIQQACNKAIQSNKGTFRGAVSGIFRKRASPFTDTANLFPGQRGLTKRPMSSLLSVNQLKRIVGGGRNDNMVFAGQCTAVGIVRTIRGKTSLCAKFPDNNISSFGGNAAASPIVPTGPPGAVGGIIPTIPAGAVGGIIPARPAGAVADAAPGSANVPNRFNDISSVIVPTKPPGAVDGVIPTRPQGAG